jgi:hypothetical protein
MPSEGPRDGRDAHPLVCQARDHREALLHHEARPLAGGLAVQAPAGQGRSDSAAQFRLAIDTNEDNPWVGADQYIMVATLDTS